MDEIKESNNYIDNARFLELIKEYHVTGTICEELWLCFYKLSTNYAHLKCFRGYSYIEDMKMEALIRCIRYIKSFDHETKSNPFSYFTTVVHNSFLQFLNKEKNQQNKKWKEMRIYYENFLLEYNIDLKLPDGIYERMYGDVKPK